MVSTRYPLCTYLHGILLLLRFPISSRRFWEYLIMLQTNINLEIFYSFSFQETHRDTNTDMRIPRRKFLKNSLRSPHHCWAGKKLLLSTCKMPVSWFYEYIIGRNINKINIRRKNTCRQWIIPFKEIRSCKLSLQRRGNFNNI